MIRYLCGEHHCFVQIILNIPIYVANAFPIDSLSIHDHLIMVSNLELCNLVFILYIYDHSATFFHSNQLYELHAIQIA